MAEGGEGREEEGGGIWRWTEERESKGEGGEEVGLIRTVGGGEEIEWRVSIAETRAEEGEGDCWRITMMSEGLNCPEVAF